MATVESSDVEEACADALLTACALTLLLGGQEVTFEETIGAAEAALRRVIRRTMFEGAKPR